MRKKYNIFYIILLLLFILFILLLINSLNVKYKKLFENMDDDYPPIFVISLQKRQERREHIKNEFENNNIKNWQFFDAYEPTDEEMKKYPNRRKGKVGVTISHRLVWEKCLELNKPVFIFEDDVYFVNFSYDDIKLLNNNKDKWDIAWFGYCYEKKGENIIGNFCKSYRPRCRHSYIITPECAKILLDNIDFKSNGDEQMGSLIKNNKIKSLSLFPATVEQSWQKKDYTFLGSDTDPEKFKKYLKK